MFTKNHSAIIKGVAILMMMWHHCFLPGRYEHYSIIFWPLAENQAVNIAGYFKICVSLFVFVSGYGLYLSYVNCKHASSTRSNKVATGWILSRLVKTLSGYWFIVLASWIICTSIDQHPLKAYGFDQSWLYGGFRAALDFLGLSNFFGLDTMNGTWWYMSAAVVFILLTPLLYEILKRYGWLCVCGIAFILPRLRGEYPGGTNLWSFLPMFCIGMAFAQNKIFEKWTAFWMGMRGDQFVPILKFAFLLLLVSLSYKLYYWLPVSKFWDFKWGILPLPIILFIRDYVSIVPIVRQTLYYLGNRSMNVFLIHTFIRFYYCERFTYSMKYAAMIILVLLATSLALSEAAEFMKLSLRYNQWFGKICAKIERLWGLGQQP